MRLPSHITFTGIDALTDLDRVEWLSVRYPIEWGILFGAKKTPRYPSAGVICEALETPVVFAAHLCGKFAEEFQSGDDCMEFGRFQRIQVNMKAHSYDLGALSNRSLLIRRRLIIQVRGSYFPNDAFFEYLHDESGGRGTTAEWPTAPCNHFLTGYAGGITPDNVRDRIKTIRANDYWIDMETGVRTDDWLDLDKCAAVCKAVYGERG